MMNQLQFILKIQLKSSKINKKNSGFTLIELLVSMIIAVLVITPLMMFMINVLDSDRREQAKVTTEQDVQAAIDYIARDLQQAVYIYDADGVTRNRNTTDTSLSGIKDQIPPVKGTSGCNSSNANNCTPVLVFWKREFLANSVGVTANNQTSDADTDDGFAYTLVAYYLITNPSSTPPWSPAARLARFQIRGKVNAANATTALGNVPDPGFNPPPLALTISGAMLKDKMNQWQTSADAYTNPVLTLVDYVSTTSPTVNCPSPNGVGNSSSGFFACVSAKDVLAQVYLRGNSLVRLQKNNNTDYNNSAAPYFPSANIRVQGRGFLFTK